MVSTTNIHKKLMTGTVSGPWLVLSVSIHVFPFMKVSYISQLAVQDSRCIRLGMPFHHPEHKLQIQHLLLTGRVTLPHKHSEAHGSSLSHGLRKFNMSRNSNTSSILSNSNSPEGRRANRSQIKLTFL